MTHYFITIMYVCYLIGFIIQIGRHYLKENNWPHILSLFFIWIGFSIQTVYLIISWIQIKHFPVVGLFESLFFFGYNLIIVYIILINKLNKYYLSANLLYSCALIILLPTIWLDKLVNPLTPILNTPLFLIHIAFAFSAYAFFAGSAFVSIGYLIREYQPLISFMEFFNSFGFYLFSICMLAGYIWAYIAWEAYWIWNIKGLWSFALWLYYSGLIHLKFIKRLSYRQKAYLSIIGFGIALFTFLGLGLLMNGTHRLL